MHVRFAIAGLLAPVLLGCGAKQAPPSVILVSIDTLRADHVGCYGYPRDTTPFLDRFAEGATVFENAFTVCPWTLVAHMTMLTGLFPAQHGVVTSELALSKDVPLLAERMHDGGYQTIGLYFPSWIHERFGFDRGFDVFRPHESAEQAGEHLREELAKVDRTRPFFLFYHLFDVHNGPIDKGDQMIYASPEPFEDMFMPGASHKLPKIPPDELWTSENLLKSDELEALIALYDGGVRHVDTRLAEAFDWMESQGLLANTLVIVTADHGESLGQRGRLTGHGELAQEGLHVPLIVRHPRGLEAGKRVREIVQLGDLVPTILDLAGLPRDPRLPGRPLFGDLPPERVVTGTHMPTVEVPSQFVVRWPDKIIKGNGVGSVLFDLEKDPRELRPERVPDARFDALEREAYPHGTSWGAPVPLGAIPDEERAALNALGYGGEGDR